MTNLYGSHMTYINQVTSLTPSQFGDKIDLFYGHIAAAANVVAVNIFSEENLEMTVGLVVDVPEDSDPQDYFMHEIDAAMKDALSKATLGVRAKIAERVDQPVGV